HELLNLVLRNMLDVGLAGIEHLDLLGVGIKSGDFVAGFGEPQAQGQADVSTADDGNLQLAAFEEFGFPVDWHDLRRAPDIFGNTTGAGLLAQRQLTIASPKVS